jgi:hypothetical protein
VIDVDKIGSATSPLGLAKTVALVSTCESTKAGDVVVVRALTDSATYNMLELPTGRLAKINPGDLLLGVLGRRRALKGFVGDVPPSLQHGDQLHLLNLGGVIGYCTGHHSSLGDAIELEVIGLACDESGRVLNIADAALPPRATLGESAPIVMIAGTSMNSGKTYAATELIKQATRAGLRVAAAKLSGVACLRDTLNMADHGAVTTASFLDCGLPSTVDVADLAPSAKAIIARLNEVESGSDRDRAGRWNSRWLFGRYGLATSNCSTRRRRSCSARLITSARGAASSCCAGAVSRWM